MKWTKKGNIFNPTDHKIGGKPVHFAQSPQSLVFDEYVRIYFSHRVNDDAGKFLSHIGYVDFDKKFSRVINISSEPVIELGGLGCFDEHGIFPINILRDGDNIYAYTCGWSRRISVPVETSTGFAVSNDQGCTFIKTGTGPVLTSSLHEPMLVGDSFVKKYDGNYHMWYIFGQRWLPATENEPVARIYKIAHAISTDGIHWNKDEGKPIIADRLGEQECQALPTVIKIKDTWHMYFCYRFATDFRTNFSRTYRLGYAYSTDLVNWTRDDEKAGITVAESGWDSEMMCYPHIFECDGKICLLYNGNEFGKHGFGLAVLDDE